MNWLVGTDHTPWHLNPDFPWIWTPKQTEPVWVILTFIRLERSAWIVSHYSINIQTHIKWCSFRQVTAGREFVNGQGIALAAVYRDRANVNPTKQVGISGQGRRIVYTGCAKMSWPCIIKIQIWGDSIHHAPGLRQWRHVYWLCMSRFGLSNFRWNTIC